MGAVCETLGPGAGLAGLESQLCLRSLVPQPVPLPFSFPQGGRGPGSTCGLGLLGKFQQ